MKLTKKLIAFAMAAFMVLALVPAFAAGGNARPLTESERAAKLEKLMVFSGKTTDIINAYDGTIASRGENDEFALARIIVKYKGELTDENAVAHAEGYNDWHVFQYASPAEAEAACEAFKKMKGVQWAEPDEIMTVCATPGSSSFNSWGYGPTHVNAYEYNQWLYAQYGNSVAAMPTIIVAVVDTGADQDHPYLVDRLIPGYNFINNTNNPEDGHSHGTHVSGTVVDGTFANVKIMPVKVLSDAGSGTTLQVCNGMEFGYLNGADVENLSLGGGCDHAEGHFMMAEVIDEAYDNGCTVCVAAGNENDNAENHCPANVRRACTVASIGTSHSRSYFSNYGECVDIAAPGENIYSSIPGGSYGYKDGTSMATPHVSAIAAQIKTANPDMNADEVVSAIKGAAASISATNIGAGMLHVAANMYDLDPAANAEGYFNHFVSTGSYAWTVDGDSVVSGNAGVNNSTSTLITRVSVGYEETLTFDYKVSSEEGADYLRVKVNGTTVFETSGEHDWDTASVTIPGYGSAEITFEYKKNASGAAGSDKAWIRNVKVDGSLSSAANITGGTEIFSSSGEYPWVADRAEHAAKSGNAGVDNSTSSMTVSLELKKAMIVKFKYKVSAASGDRFTFLDNDRIALNSGATEGYVEYEYSVPSTGMHTFTFTFTKNASGSSGDDCAYVKCFYYIHSFESAINGSDNFLPFINDGEYPWVAAGDAASSSNWGEANSQSDLLLELPMNAGETLTFKYRASSESNYDFLRFYVDGTQMFQQSGNNTNWTTYTFTATSTKTYVFKWSYQKDYSADTNDDCGYVKEVVYSGVYVVANGDADDDGDVDSADALLILRYAMGLVDESQIDLTKSDVDGNGIVDSADALIVLRRTMGVSDR